MTHSTRYQELGYEQFDRNVWRIIDKSDGRPVGPQYATLAELFGDLDRFARLFGC